METTQRHFIGSDIETIKHIPETVQIVLSTGETLKLDSQSQTDKALGHAATEAFTGVNLPFDLQSTQTNHAPQHPVRPSAGEITASLKAAREAYTKKDPTTGESQYDIDYRLAGVKFPVTDGAGIVLFTHS